MVDEAAFLRLSGYVTPGMSLTTGKWSTSPSLSPQSITTALSLVTLGGLAGIEWCLNSDQAVSTNIII
jgi:hypothetical protein